MMKSEVRAPFPLVLHDSAFDILLFCGSDVGRLGRADVKGTDTDPNPDLRLPAAIVALWLVLASLAAWLVLGLARRPDADLDIGPGRR
jgi:hypothetical protein